MQGTKGLAKFIAGYVKKRGREDGIAVRGRIAGTFVVVQNRSYPFVEAADINAGDGETVWCMITKENTAVVIGR